MEHLISNLDRKLRFKIHYCIKEIGVDTFNFLNMFSSLANLQSKPVDRYEEGDLYVSTVWINDSEKEYETAVAHPLYKEGKLIIVECYDSEEEAQIGHDKWVKIMTQEKLPSVLEDNNTSVIGTVLRESQGGSLLYEKENDNEE